MYRLLQLFAAACLLPTLADAQTILTSSYITPNAVSDQQTLCSPAFGTYPAQWTWLNGASTPIPRSARPSDNLTPRIEQHRTVNGQDTVVAVWGSFSSGGDANAQEPFLSAPYAPGETVEFPQSSGIQYPVGYTTLPNGTQEPSLAASTATGPTGISLLQAIANSGVGPFGNTAHVDLFRLWLPGDRFLVYPAVYTGTNNNIVLQRQADYYTGGTVPTFAPDNITIQGVVQNGIRPLIYRNDAGDGDSETSKDAVEILNGSNDTISDIDVQLGPNGYVLQSLVYMIGAGVDQYDANGNAVATPTGGGTTTLARMHVSDADLEESTNGGANGIFGDSTMGGTLALNALEVDHDGGSGVQGSGGAGHGIYIGDSTVDPHFAVRLSASWFHDNYYGHDAKFRAVTQVVRGNYFQGGVPQGGIYTQAEAYNLDIPNGGALIAEDNLFVKAASGINSNGFSLAYGEEGIPDKRKLSLWISHNTFVTFAADFDGQHPTVPFFFFYPAQQPGAAGFPVKPANTVVRFNAFVGYCPTGNSTLDYRGNVALISGFADLNQAFSFGGTWASASGGVVGLPAYGHVARLMVRKLASMGAED